MTELFPDRSRTIDEYLWLEDIHGEKPLAGVLQQNERTLAMFNAEQLAATRARVLEVYDSDHRIPMVTKRGEWLYNFWQDVDHPRGVWRRTSMESYTSDAPEWEVVLNIDALGEAEATEWVFAGADLCYPDYGRALVSLSPDGGDAVVIREFDVDAKQFMSDGFQVAYGKTNFAWIDQDSIFVATDFGPNSLTTSGYAREVRRWNRGTSLRNAMSVHTIDAAHMIVSAHHDLTPGFERDLVIDTIDFFNRHYYLLEDDRLVQLDLPSDADIQLHREWMTVEPKSAWTVGGQVYPAGSLLAIHLRAFLGGERDFDVLFVPDAHTALHAASWTRNHLILNLVRDVVSTVTIASPGGKRWSFRDLETPTMQTTSAFAVDEDESDAYWMVSSGYLTPSTLSLGVIAAPATSEMIKSSPALFDADSLTAEQHFAPSADGTLVPYFQVSSRDLALDGSSPTLLYGYGGFEISHTPAYDAATGRTWLEHGGVYVVANIRGGGEYGPLWHTAAMRENRQRAYEDFAAVATHLIERGVTSRDHLGCMGGSNGGLLVGNMLTQFPDLFAAIVCNVPLLDMKRYVHLNAGASWIAEYGDPDVDADWAFMQTFSPYHNLRESIAYPPVLFYTATSDDRVGPVQARKMAARMQDRGIPDVWFFENMQGGHAGSADNSQRALMKAMSMEFLKQHLF